MATGCGLHSSGWTPPHLNRRQRSVCPPQEHSADGESGADRGEQHQITLLQPPGGERVEIFGHGGGQDEAARQGIPFLGEMPLFTEIRKGGDDGPVVAAGQPDQSFDIPLRHRPEQGNVLVLGMRPEHLMVTAAGGMRVTVDVAEELGGVSYQHGTLEGGEAVIFQQTGARHGMHGTVQTVTPELARIFVFDKSGDRVR
mgnify:CR=1 FL=1